MKAGLGIGLVALATVMAATVVAGPAAADVKAGVDAWSKGDYPKAVAEWRPSAVAGDADAQFNLGQAYKLGRGVPVDPAMAQSWFAKAAAQGHAQAQDNYGLALFQDGKKAEAAPWLEKSVKRDEKRAELVLGTMLFNGDGVPKDWVRAYALVTRSSQQGLSQASTTLAQLDQYVAPEQRQQGIALAQQMASTASAQQTMPASAIEPPRAPPRIATSTADRKGADKPPRMARVDPVAPMPPRADPRPEPKTARPEARPTRPEAKPVKPEARPVRASGGAWRVQLGAFRESGAAQALWGRIGGRVGGSPAYVKAGAVTRLQATGFASKADANRACASAKAAGTACVIVAP